MFPYFPSGVSNQWVADGDRRVLSGNRETKTGNSPIPVQADYLSASGNNIIAAGIRSRRRIMGRSSGICAGIYYNFDYVEIILEKNLGGI